MNHVEQLHGQSSEHMSSSLGPVIDKFRAVLEGEGIVLVRNKIALKQIGGAERVWAIAWVQEKEEALAAESASRAENRAEDSLGVARESLAVAKRAEMRALWALSISVLAVFASIGIAINN